MIDISSAVVIILIAKSGENDLTLAEKQLSSDVVVLWRFKPRNTGD
jgi:hypothetical protein